MGKGCGGGCCCLNATWKSPLLIRQRGQRTKQQRGWLVLYWGQATVSLSPVSAGTLTAATHRNNHTQGQHTESRHGHFVAHNLKTCHLERKCKLIELNKAVSDTSLKEGPHWTNCRISCQWTYCTCFSSSKMHSHVSLLNPLPQVPLGVNVTRGLEVSVLTRLITVWQPSLRIHRMHGTDNVTSVWWKEVSKGSKRLELVFSQRAS